jgi:hypothetical protein
MARPFTSQMAINLHSLGIAQTVVSQYFFKLMNARGEVLQFYGSNASLIWDSTTCDGIASISAFINQIPVCNFVINGYNVQTVPETALWTIVIVTGTIVAPGVTRGFHATFIIDSNSETQRALIRSQFFHTF